MIDKSACYKIIGHSFVLQKYFAEKKDSLSYDDYFGFKVAHLSLDMILQEPVLKSLHQKFKIAGGGIIKLDANRCYRWHQDAVRGVSVNMLLTPEVDSFVLFGNDVVDSEDQYEIIRLDYEPETFYLFNNQAMHTVVNFSCPRYLFTVEFELDKNSLGFSDVKDFIGV